MSTDPQKEQTNEVELNNDDLDSVAGGVPVPNIRTDLETAE